MKNKKTPTLHEKYAHYITQAKSGYVRGLTYDEALEIHRFIESKIGRDLPFNFSCPNCVLQLLKNFANYAK
jgi:hypothetical protein